MSFIALVESQSAMAAVSVDPTVLQMVALLCPDSPMSSASFSAIDRSGWPVATNYGPLAKALCPSLGEHHQAGLTNDMTTISPENFEVLKMAPRPLLGKNASPHSHASRGLSQ